MHNAQVLSSPSARSPSLSGLPSPAKRGRNEVKGVKRQLRAGVGLLPSQLSCIPVKASAAGGGSTCAVASEVKLSCLKATAGEDVGCSKRRYGHRRTHECLFLFHIIIYGKFFNGKVTHISVNAQTFVKFFSSASLTYHLRHVITEALISKHILNVEVHAVAPIMVWISRDIDAFRLWVRVTQVLADGEPVLQ